MSKILLPQVVPPLRKALPRLTLIWIEDKTDALLRALKRGDLVAALLALEADLDGLDHHTVAIDPFVLAVPRGHELDRDTKPVTRCRRHPAAHDRGTHRDAPLPTDDRLEGARNCAPIVADESGWQGEKPRSTARNRLQWLTLTEAEDRGSLAHRALESTLSIDREALPQALP